MSSLKHLIDTAEVLRYIAEEVALRAGPLARCPECRETYDPLTWVYEYAYRLANHLISRRDELVDGLEDDDRRPLTDALKDIGRHYPNACPCGASGSRL
jgi:hypothetical protein